MPAPRRWDGCVTEIFEQFSYWSLIDVSIIAFIIYHIVRIIRGTRTAQMLTGMTIIAIAYTLSTIFPLNTLHWVMNKFSASLIIILIILFQDDIRHILGRMGKKSLLATDEHLSSSQLLDEIARAAMTLASKRMGALIVLERRIILSRYIEVGTLVDARVSNELLAAVFHPSSPIHDGAAIIQNGRLSAAGCFLPLSRQENLDPNMGTRHRAALGISLETDAVVVLVSEERGAVSIVVDGQLSRMASSTALRKALRSLLVEDGFTEQTDATAAPAATSSEKA